MAGKTGIFLKVECYAGYRGEETPRRFFLGRRKTDIEEILDRWIGPDYRYFKVRGEDRGIYILRLDVIEDQWELTLYDSDMLQEARLSSF